MELESPDGVMHPRLLVWNICVADAGIAPMLPNDTIQALLYAMMKKVAGLIRQCLEVEIELN